MPGQQMQIHILDVGVVVRQPGILQHEVDHIIGLPIDSLVKPPIGVGVERRVGSDSFGGQTSPVGDGLAQPHGPQPIGILCPVELPKPGLCARRTGCANRPGRHAPCQDGHNHA